MINTQVEDQLIISDPDIMGGTPVFRGTRVPVIALFDYLEAGDSIPTFLDHFPTVERTQVIALLEHLKKVVLPIPNQNHVE